MHTRKHKHQIAFGESHSRCSFLAILFVTNNKVGAYCFNNKTSLHGQLITLLNKSVESSITVG